MQFHAAMESTCEIETLYFGPHSGLMKTFVVLQAVSVLFNYNSTGLCDEESVFYLSRQAAGKLFISLDSANNL